MVGRKWVELRWKVRSLAPPIITDNYDSHLELSEATEEETDAKTANQGETDEVSQLYVILLSLKGYPTIV